MSSVLFESVARPLLLAHAVAGFSALFAGTHHAAHAVLSACGRDQRRELRRFGLICPALMLAQLALGLALYPAYRVHVRAADLDRAAPFIAQLFDLKEHLAALAFALVLAASFAGRAQARLAPRPQLQPTEPPRPAAPPDAAPPDAAPFHAVRSVAAASVAALSVAGAALLWAATLIGLYVTARHPV